MTLQISGKHVDLGPALRNHAEDRIRGVVEKYFRGGFNGQVTMEREGSGVRSECTIHLDSGIVLHAKGVAQDAPASFDLAAERIEKRLRRYKRRLREHQNGPRGEAFDAASFVLASPGEDDEPVGDNPVVIAEETAALRTMSVGGAVMQLDLADLPFVVFRHARHGGINIVYRRPDGHIGWIDPLLPAGRRDADG